MVADLRLDEPVEGDLDDLHRICSDPRVWTHYPSLRHTHVDTTRGMLREWFVHWSTDGLGYWVVRTDDGVVGYGGCAARDDVWNLGYRVAPEAWGSGCATTVARAGIAAARRVDADRPVVALLLEHNEASLRVARRVGLELVHRGPDRDNPDPSAVRLLLADQDLEPARVERLVGPVS